MSRQNSSNKLFSSKILPDTVFIIRYIILPLMIWLIYVSHLSRCLYIFPRHLGNQLIADLLWDTKRMSNQGHVITL